MATTVFPVAVRLEAEERVVRALTPLLRVVAHPGPLRPGRRARGPRGPGRTPGWCAGGAARRGPARVGRGARRAGGRGAGRGAARSGAGPFRRGSGGPHDTLEGPVILEDRGGVAAIQPRDDGVGQRQQHLGRLVGRLPRGGAQRLLQEPLESKALTKGVNQGHPREVCQVGFLEDDGQVAEPFGMAYKPTR
jgi:hypothetical protein